MSSSEPQHPQSPRTLTVRLALQRHPAVGKNRLYEGIRSGRLHAVKVGRRLAIDVVALDEWVENGSPARNHD